MTTLKAIDDSVKCIVDVVCIATIGITVESLMTADYMLNTSTHVQCYPRPTGLKRMIEQA